MRAVFQFSNFVFLLSFVFSKQTES